MSHPPIYAHKPASKHTSEPHHSVFGRRCSEIRSKDEEDFDDAYDDNPSSPRSQASSTRRRSDIEARFLNLPDSQDFERQRNFDITHDGAFVNRGDTFRRRSNASSPSDSLSPSPSNDTMAPVFRVLVLGSRGTGKSSLVQQMCSSEHSNPFNREEEEDEEGEIAETGLCVSVDRTTCELRMTEVNIDETDKYTAMTCDGYLFVYAANDINTFTHCESALRHFHAQGTAATLRPKFLVANKVDLARKLVVSEHDARNIARKFNAKYMEVSVALEHNTDALLIELVKSMRMFVKRGSWAEVREHYGSDASNGGPVPAIAPESAEHPAALSFLSKIKAKISNFFPDVSST